MVITNSAGGTGTIIRVQDEDGTVANISCDRSNDGGAVTDTTDVIDAYCDLEDGDDDTDVLVIVIQESPDPDDDGTGDMLNSGDVSGLQYPATIIDTSAIEAEATELEPNLSESDDVVIDSE